MIEKLQHAYSPEHAPHIQGQYNDRHVDADGIPEEALVVATCTVCGAMFRRMCASGLMRTHIARFASVHLHRTMNDPIPTKR